MRKRRKADDGEHDRLVVNTREPSLGPGRFVRVEGDRGVYLFANGGERSFTEAYCRLYMKPAFGVAPEIRDRLLPRRVPKQPVPLPPLPRKKPPPQPTNDTFEARIYESPDDDGMYLAYADWLLLQDEHDLRGRLITLQAQRAADPDDSKAASAEKALLRNHAAFFVPEALARALALPKRSKPRCEVEWRNGFFAQLRLARDPELPTDLGIVARAVFAHPSARFLRGVSVGTICDYSAIIAAIAKQRRPALREVQLDGELAGNASGVTSLLGAAPALEKLAIKTGTLALEPWIQHANLRELSLAALSLRDDTVDTLLDAKLPELATLVLRVDGLTLTRSQIARLRSGERVPKLRTLVMENARGINELVLSLLGSPLLAQLETLDLAGGDLDDRTASEMMGEREQFQHLRHLEVASGRLSPDWATRLAAATGARTERLIISTRFGAELRAPDRASTVAARKIAHADQWLVLGYDPRLKRVWGEYEGRDHYYVYAHLNDRAVGCRCGSPKSPCKHALALLMLVADRFPFPQAAIPDALGRSATPWRPSYARDRED